MDNRYYLEGISKYKKRDFQGAIVDFTYAIEKDPVNPDILYERGMSYFHINKRSLALMDLDKALELQPNNPYRYSSRAFMKDACGDIIGAVEDYKMAIELDPQDAVAHNNLGLLEEKMGRMSNAKKHFDKADEIAKTNPQFNGMYGNSSNPIIDPVLKFNGDKHEEKPALPEEEEKVVTFGDYLTVIKGIFTSKSSFKEFISFVKKGFKF